MANVKAGLALLHSQFFVKLPNSTKSFAGQTVIITGSNTGLGLGAALKIVDLDAEKVILAVRDTTKGKEAKQSIEKATGRKQIIEVWSLDLSSYDSVKAFVAKVVELPRIDVVLENAGISTHKFVKFEENESTLTVNLVSTFLLALLILPKLRESARLHGITPRLSIVCSSVHHFVNLDDAKNHSHILGGMNTESTANMKTRYFDSKLLQVLYSGELAAAMSASEKAGKAPVILNILNPGLCESGLVQNPSLLHRLQMKIMGRSTEEGSRTLVHAVEARKESTHGQYLSDCKVASVSAFVQSDEGQRTAQRIFKELNEKLELIQPGILDNI